VRHCPFTFGLKYERKFVIQDCLLFYIPKCIIRFAGIEDSHSAAKVDHGTITALAAR
jgi:hypothetical protein